MDRWCCGQDLASGSKCPPIHVHQRWYLTYWVTPSLCLLFAWLPSVSTVPSTMMCSGYWNHYLQKTLISLHLDNMHSFFPPSPFPPQMLPDPVSCSSTLCFAAPVGTLLTNEAVTVKSYTAGAFVMAGGRKTIAGYPRTTSFWLDPSNSGNLSKPYDCWWLGFKQCLKRARITLCMVSQFHFAFETYCLSFLTLPLSLSLPLLKSISNWGPEQMYLQPKILTMGLASASKLVWVKTGVWEIQPTMKPN